MGDECTCGKCQAVSVGVRGAVAWLIKRDEVRADGRTRAPRELYLVISEAGVSLRLSPEM